jgi:CBS domain-containing protein
MQCPSCGHENPPGEEVCESCLHDIHDLAHPRPTGPVSASIMNDPVERLQSRPAPTVRPSDSVATAVARMNEEGVGAAVVVDGGVGNTLRGVVTERDVLYKTPPGADLSGVKVEAIMTPEPETVAADAPIAFCLHKMAVGGFRHVPIVAGGRPAAIVSVRDVLKYFARHLEAH